MTLTFALMLLLADAPSETRETVATFAGAIANDNVEDALAQVNKSLKDYGKFARNLRALLQQYEVTSSISPLTNEGDDSKRTLELDWYLEIRSKSGELALTRRRETIHCILERTPKKKWMITAIEPAGFLALP